MFSGSVLLWVFMYMQAGSNLKFVVTAGDAGRAGSCLCMKQHCTFGEPVGPYDIASWVSASYANNDGSMMSAGHHKKTNHLLLLTGPED